MKYLIILSLFINSILQSQNFSIRGKILDATSKLPLAFANIIVDGTQNGAVSDENGDFSISFGLTKNSVLIVSYVGFETKRIIAGSLSSKRLNYVFLDKKVLSSQTVLVKGIIGKKGSTPITFSKIKRDEIKESYINQDIPEYLSYLPSSTFYSEGGSGVGYNYLSIRGFDQRRISVSINGIPQNDPEDHNVYWVDFPDLLESTELVQVQRGAGSGVTGYPAVGGSINIITSVFSEKSGFDFAVSLGSYNTRKYTASFSSGLIDQKYSIYAKLGQVLSSGYRSGSWANFKSYHISAVRYDNNFTTQINIFGGPIADGLVYTGLAKFAVKDKEQRKANYSYWEADKDKYTFTVERRPEEKENFSQPHFELLNELSISKNVTLNSALFLVLGNGFFDFDGSWANFSYLRLTPDNGFDINGDPDTLFLTNTLIRAQVENKQWGWIPRLSIDHSNGTLILGGELRFHRSVHWGNINFAEGMPAGVPRDFRYYYYEGSKNIFTIYAHDDYRVNKRLNLLAELQFAYHNYKIDNERFVGTKFNVNDLFFNPRIGINYRFSGGVNSYISFARVTREPRLKNYYDAAESSGGAVPQFNLNSNGNFDFNSPLVKPETMSSFELGTNFVSNDFNAGVNLFYMLFTDEIVKKGQVDRFGQPVTGNADRTIHTGIELTGDFKFSEHLQLILNGSYSKNYINSGNQFISFKDPKNGKDSVGLIDLKGNRISGFPDLTFNGILKFRYNGITLQLLAKYVGKFFSDNFDDRLNYYSSSYPGFVNYSDNIVDAYFTSNFIASYDFQLQPAFRNIKLFAQVNNIFDNLYTAYAIGKEFFPAAERNFIAGIKLGI